MASCGHRGAAACCHATRRQLSAAASCTHYSLTSGPSTSTDTLATLGRLHAILPRPELAAKCSDLEPVPAH